jgi:8-oxo-dGTP pyrophosphatase MutT (NUDIX family)
MHRRPLLQMLARYCDVFPSEIATIDRIRRLIEAHPDCFARSCRPGHITAAAWILSADRRRYLLTHHRKLDRWLQLGGHADGQSDVEQVALREAREESGLTAFDIVLIDGMLMPIDVDVHEIPTRYDNEGQLIEDAHEHHDIRFLMVAHTDDELRVSDESHDVRWLTAEEVLERTNEESVLRMLRKAFELIA